MFIPRPSCRLSVGCQELRCMVTAPVGWPLSRDPILSLGSTKAALSPPFGLWVVAASSGGQSLGTWPSPALCPHLCKYPFTALSSLNLSICVLPRLSLIRVIAQVLQNMIKKKELGAEAKNRRM